MDKPTMKEFITIVKGPKALIATNDKGEFLPCSTLARACDAAAEPDSGVDLEEVDSVCGDEPLWDPYTAANKVLMAFVQTVRAPLHDPVECHAYLKKGQPFIGTMTAEYADGTVRMVIHLTCDDGEVCQNCGEHVAPGMERCPKCGAALTGGASTKEYCGAEGEAQ